MSGARLRYVLCHTCHRIARIAVCGTSEIATHYMPEIPDRNFDDIHGARCASCTAGSGVDYNLMYNCIPLALTRCVRLSYLSQRWVTVDCESVLVTISPERFAELAAKVQQHFPPTIMVSAADLRRLIIVNLLF
jgi:hypothetical protein